MADEHMTPPGASIADVVAILNQIARNGSLLAQTMSAVLPRINGTFTLSAAASTTVTQPQVKADSLIQWFPSNAAAATLEGSAKHLYPSTINAGSNFIMTTASGSTAAGTETFKYTIINPT